MSELLIQDGVRVVVYVTDDIALVKQSGDENAYKILNFACFYPKL